MKTTFPFPFFPGVKREVKKMADYNGINVWLPAEIVSEIMLHNKDEENLIETLARMLQVTLKRETNQPKKKAIKYDVSGLEIGEIIIFPWRKNEDGVNIDSRSIYNSVANQSKKTGRKFRCEPKPMGVKVTRLE